MGYEVIITPEAASGLNSFFSTKGISGNPIKAGNYDSSNGLGGVIARLIKQPGYKGIPRNIIGLAVEKALEYGCTKKRIKKGLDEGKYQNSQAPEQLELDLGAGVYPYKAETNHLNPDGSRKRRREKNYSH